MLNNSENAEKTIEIEYFLSNELQKQLYLNNEDYNNKRIIIVPATPTIMKYAELNRTTNTYRISLCRFFDNLQTKESILKTIQECEPDNRTSIKADFHKLSKTNKIIFVFTAFFICLITSLSFLKLFDISRPVFLALFIADVFFYFYIINILNPYHHPVNAKLTPSPFINKALAALGIFIGILTGAGFVFHA
ncbi:MAG: hypothetical protein WC725_05080 [Patescibacteria group bacterium]|jgi:hypothetical protein